MVHYLIELALWLLLAYFVGCLIGYLLRRWLGRDAVAQPLVESAPETMPEAPPAIAVEPVAVPLAAAVEQTAPATPPVAARMERPRGLAEPRDGNPDDLQRISGIGPKNEKILHSLGFFHFDQIAAWSAGEVAWVDDHLRFNGRIAREKWIDQAVLLAEGRHEEFHALYGTGGLKNAKGETESGSRTRRS